MRNIFLKGLSFLPLLMIIGGFEDNTDSGSTIGAAFILEKERSVIGHCVDHSDCGTGKTLKAMLMIFADVNKRLKTPTTTNAPYKPTLVLCPPQAVAVWYADWQRFLRKRLHMKIFYRSQDIENGPMQDVTISKDENDESHWHALEKFLDGLDPTDPAVCAL